ncbi:MAG: hypothetical protein GF332_03100 [Candidatus Moranbacteria bacterium]|nr:hypothetical protein [Candidatus Moranbacteria bacterium]
MKKSVIIILIIIVALIIAGINFYIYFIRHKENWTFFNPKPSNQDQEKQNPAVSLNQIGKLETFKSVQDFQDYLNQAQSKSKLFNQFSTIQSTDQAIPFGTEKQAPTEVDRGVELANQDRPAERYSQTNVQVQAIDEPDLVKTDGYNLYYSPQLIRFIPEPISIEQNNPNLNQTSIKPRQPEKSNTYTFKVNPPGAIDHLTNLEPQGDLLIGQDRLLIISQTQSKIQAMDISEPDKPTPAWSLELSERARIISSRLFENHVYLVLLNNPNHQKPCPIQPLKASNSAAEILCENVYHPIIPQSINNIITVYKVALDSGSIMAKTAFTSPDHKSIIYMSTSGLYLTYTSQLDQYTLMRGFYQAYSEDFPEEIIVKIEELNQYPISQAAKQVEILNIIQSYQDTLTKEQAKDFQNKSKKLFEEYQNKNKRELEKTVIIKLSLQDLQVQNTGTVPGHLLNQFALDQHQDHLRVATTIGNSFGNRDSVNDVYVLDANLETKGSVQDLGLDERIYSVRFINDLGYVVTFREIDPFYVLDFQDPTNPTLTGELKIPGYSSYLHPLKQNLILGIGKEENQVKLSLFDVTDSNNPQELTKYLLDDAYSQTLANHHAFLQDQEHKIFFLPAGNKGYVFSYAQDLELVLTVDKIQAQRAVYLNDYLYLVGREKILVIDENSWEVIKALDFHTIE